MAKVELGISHHTIGLIEFNGALSKIATALGRLEATAPVPIEGHGLEITYQGAPLVDVRQEITGSDGKILITTELRPAAGLGLLVATVRAISAGAATVAWERGWPNVSLPPPPPVEDTARERPVREIVET
jgi:hypothetical protein